MNYLYHNPMCSKSRAALRYLIDKGINFEVILYLEQKINKTEIENLLNYLEIPLFELIRTQENIWNTAYAHQSLSDNELIEILVKYPILLQRPIYVANNKALIARPLEKLQKFIESSSGPANYSINKTTEQNDDKR